MAGIRGTGVIVLLAVAAWFSDNAAVAERTADGNWVPLFNGKDLTGWDTWLGKPHKSVTGLELKKNDNGEYIEPVGLNKDPKHVYSVVTTDGGPALFITGEIFGAITTKEEYENYHFRCDFKWGTKKYAPRDKQPMDSGILYHCTGEPGAIAGFFMQSVECQVMEHDCGDCYSVGGPIMDTEGERKDGKGPVLFRKGGMKFTVPSPGIGGRVVRLAENEKPNGEWNTMEVICLGQTSIHVANGKVEAVLTNLRRKQGDKEVPLTKGKIQLQSEGAEIYYRNLAIRTIKELPEQYK